MPYGNYPCILWRDRGFLGPKRLEDFHTGLDPEDPISLEHALLAAAQRDPSFSGDLTPYGLQVRAPDNPDDVIVDNYRHTPWLYDQVPEEDL